MAKQGRYCSGQGQYVTFEKIPKGRGLEMLSEIRQLFGSKVDLQVLLLDATVTGHDNPVWHPNSASARRHPYYSSMSENIEEVDFDGFR
jgi:hypothetical protein